jgi:hypothetical protein
MASIMGQFGKPQALASSGPPPGAQVQRRLEQPRQLGQFGLPKNPVATATTQSPAFDDEAFNSFMGGLDDSQRNMINQFVGMQRQQVHQDMQRQMQMGGMGGGIMGMAPPQMRGYMPMMQSPMQMGGYMPRQMGMMGGMGGPMMGGYMPQPQMMGGYGYGNPMMGGMMGMAPPQMRQMAMMPQQAMMYGGYQPQPRQAMPGEHPAQMMRQAYNQSNLQQAANYGGQSPQPNTQQAVYAQPQAASPFGGALRGYYA